MTTLRVDPQNPEAGPIGRAAAIIRRGGLVAFPTETVYGLGANGLDDAAVARVYRAKGRPSHNPLIVHVPDADHARELVVGWPPVAERLAGAFWPGPLTMVLRRHDRVPARVSAGLDTVAVRVPAHPVALALLHAADLPIVAPSANPSSGVSPTRAEHVERGLGGRVELVLDAGPTGVGIESTVVDLTGDRPVLLRPGALSTDQLRAFAGELEEGADAGGAVARSSPGMLERHYAPRAAVHVFARSAAAGARQRGHRAAEQGLTVGAMVLDRAAPMPELAHAHHVVRMPLDAAGYARELYDVLHRLDAAGCDLILIEDVPSTPQWAGVRDRLRRAGEEPEP